MANGLGDLSERLQVIETKLDGLGAAVDEAFAAHRAYTDFAFETLDSKMESGFVRLDQNMDAGFAQTDVRFARLERKIDQIIELHVERPPDKSKSD